MVNNLMLDKFVKVICDVDCEWREISPRYRVYVNDELFTERTWIWRQSYLEEMLQISAPPGLYYIRFELLNSEPSRLATCNMRVESGDARIVDGNIVEILP